MHWEVPELSGSSQGDGTRAESDLHTVERDPEIEHLSASMCSTQSLWNVDGLTRCWCVLAKV